MGAGLRCRLMRGVVGERRRALVSAVQGDGALIHVRSSCSRTRTRDDARGPAAPRTCTLAGPCDDSCVYVRIRVHALLRGPACKAGCVPSGVVAPMLQESAEVIRVCLRGVFNCLCIRHFV